MNPKSTVNAKSLAIVCGTVVLVALIAATTFLIYTGMDEKVEGRNDSPSSFLSGSVSVGTATDQPSISELNPETNRTEGFDADFARWLGDHSNGQWTPALSPVSIAGRIPALQQKNGLKLVIDSFSMNDERYKLIDMAGPYIVTDEGVMARQGDERFKDPGSLTGARVCTVRGSTSEQELIRRGALISNPDAIGECVKQLLGNQVDVVSIDQLILFGLARTTPGVKVEDVRFGFREQYGIGLPYGSLQECQQLTDQITRFVNSPDWAQYFRNAFGSELDPNRYKPAAFNPCKVRTN